MYVMMQPQSASQPGSQPATSQNPQIPQNRSQQIHKSEYKKTPKDQTSPNPQKQRSLLDKSPTPKTINQQSNHWGMYSSTHSRGWD